MHPSTTIIHQSRLRNIDGIDNQVLQQITEQKIRFQNYTTTAIQTLDHIQQNIEEKQIKKEQLVKEKNELVHKKEIEKEKSTLLTQHSNELQFLLTPLIKQSEKLKLQITNLDREIENNSSNTSSSDATSQEEFIQNMTRSAANFKKIGLSMHNVPGEKLRIEFRLVDKKDPHRVFSFVVFVKNGETYVVEKVKPPVPVLDSLVKDLNATNDFSLFARKMRKEFQRIANNET
jgi:hypothetical protein